MSTAPINFEAERAEADAREQAHLLEQALADPDDYGVPVHLFDDLPDDWLIGLACALAFGAWVIAMVTAPYWWPQ